MIPANEVEKRKSIAIKYMDRVINQMALSNTDITSVIRRYAAKLIEESYKNKNISEEKVSGIIEGLQKELFNIIYIRCLNADAIAHEKEKETRTDKYVLAFFSLEVSGLTIQDRIKNYSQQIRYEIEAYITAGINRGMNPVQILNSYLTWLKNPFASPLILEAIRKGILKNEALLNKISILQKNKYKSALNNLVRLHQDSIIRAYNHTINSIWLANKNIVGWYTVRGSSYPCTVCDMNIGLFHSKDEFFYGYHPRCCCLMLPVYFYDL